MVKATTRFYEKDMIRSRRDVPNAPCSNCRKKHLKCDWNAHFEDGAGQAMVCRRCSLMGEKCIQGLNIRFKHSPDELTLDPHQPWVQCPREVRFVDETPYVAEDSYPFIPDPVFHSLDDVAVLRNGPRGGGGMARSPACSLDMALQRGMPDPAERPLCSPPEGSRLLLHSLSSSSTAHCVAFPLRDPDEARLMKYYLEYMCNWFDLCDVSRQFALKVPLRAMSSPTLRNAIFALSSRHLSLRGQFDEYASTRYHQECLRQLSSVSHGSPDLLDDNLLAATILLRTLEELDVPLLGNDYESHLLGIQVFMNTHGPAAVASDLRKASYWVGLRQEVTMALSSQRPIKISLCHSFIDQSLTEASDDMWANRIIVHCADVVQFCFGDDNQRPADYRRLLKYDDDWLHSRPLSFIPVAFSAADPGMGEAFPRIMYLSHSVGGFNLGMPLPLFFLVGLN
ncbi:hypothetical protein HC256_006869 [Beauveria bassiana]|nr:hypothetical protein HC256_006869 [Beauveria bassiana]